MGADLIGAIHAKRTGAPLDFPAAHALVEKLTDSDFSQCFIDDIMGGGEWDLAEAKARVHAALDEVEGMWTGCWRTVNIFDDILGGYDVLFIGETTWGDTPEGYDSAVAVYEVDRIRRALNLVDLTTGGV